MLRWFKEQRQLTGMSASRNQLSYCCLKVTIHWESELPLPFALFFMRAGMIRLDPWKGNDGASNG